MNKVFVDADVARKGIEIHLFPLLKTLGYDAVFINDGIEIGRAHV